MDTDKEKYPAFAKLENQGWQPIETAPKNGKPFVVFQHLVEDIHDVDNYWTADFFEGEFVCGAPEPTHWKALNPPSEDKTPNLLKAFELAMTGLDTLDCRCEWNPIELCSVCRVKAEIQKLGGG